MDKKWIFGFRRRRRIEGEPMLFEEAEQYLLKKLSDPNGDPHEAKLELVRFYCDFGHEAEAMRYAEEYLAESTDPVEIAMMVFHQGQIMEHLKDWDSAIRFYARALELSSHLEIDRYFFHNNIGYSLNQVKRYAEAEPYLREAIRLDPSRANAFKNLGLSLQGQRKLTDAAWSFIAAVRADAADSRALKHLEELAEQHKELYADIPDLEFQISKCQEAVEYARSQQPPPPFRIH